MSKINQFIKTVFEKTQQSNCFGRSMAKVKLLSADEGKCTAELKIEEEHLNYAGTMHGGFTSTLIDCISSYALFTSKFGHPGLSVDLHIMFMKAAFPGDVLSITANTVKAGKSMAFVEVEIKKKDDGEIIARGIQTKYAGDK